MDIKLGEYIRTNEGEIFKVGRISDDYLAEIKEYGGTGCFTEDVTKHSFNIIDLIEVGDIIKILNEYDEEVVVYIDADSFWKKLKRELNVEVFHLKSIVTKEQFKAMEYEV